MLAPGTSILNEYTAVDLDLNIFSTTCTSTINISTKFSTINMSTGTAVDV